MVKFHVLSSKRLAIAKFLVLEKARFLDIDSSVSYLRDFKNNYKNILYNEYVGFLVGGVGEKIDSLSVEGAYKKGVFNGDFLSPLSVIISEVRFSDFSIAKTAFNEFKISNDFDFVLKKYKGDVREPIPENKGGEVGLFAFSLKEGDVSNIIENNDGSFSLRLVMQHLFFHRLKTLSLNSPCLILIFIFEILSVGPTWTSS